MPHVYTLEGARSAPVSFQGRHAPISMGFTPETDQVLVMTGIGVGGFLLGLLGGWLMGRRR